MKREELKQIAELTDEQLDKIMAINGADVEKVKAKVTALEADLKQAKETIDKTNTEFEALKSSNAGAEEYKTKYEALVAENEAKAKQHNIPYYISLPLDPKIARLCDEGKIDEVNETYFNDLLIEILK